MDEPVTSAHLLAPYPGQHDYWYRHRSWKVKMYSSDRLRERACSTQLLIAGCGKVKEQPEESLTSRFTAAPTRWWF